MHGPSNADQSLDDVARCQALYSDMLEHVTASGWLQQALGKHRFQLPPLLRAWNKEIEAAEKRPLTRWERLFGKAAPKDYTVERFALLHGAIVSYAELSGWLQSALAHRPVDRSGAPIPYITFACMYLLSERARKTHSVFEFGSGASTFWWAERVERVISVEHSKRWHREQIQRVPGNVELLFRPLTENGPYSNTARERPEKFDIIVIDGRDRANCALNSVEALTPGGVIVWDNSEREPYQAAQDKLVSMGFRKLPFRSTGPVNKKPGETSVFYRPGNCLDL